MRPFLLGLCGSKLRARVLAAIWSRPAQALGVRALAAAAGVDPSNTARLLPTLVDAGLCDRIDTTPPRYRAAYANPAFAELVTIFSSDGANDQHTPVKVAVRAAQRGTLKPRQARSAKAAQQSHDHGQVFSGRARAESMYLIPPRLARAAVVKYRDVDFDE